MGRKPRVVTVSFLYTSASKRTHAKWFYLRDFLGNLPSSIALNAFVSLGALVITIFRRFIKASRDDIEQET